jgi:hypothetical protein
MYVKSYKSRSLRKGSTLRQEKSTSILLPCVRWTEGKKIKGKDATFTRVSSDPRSFFLIKPLYRQLHFGCKIAHWKACSNPDSVLVGNFCKFLIHSLTPKISGPFCWILGLKYVLIDMWGNDQNEMMFFYFQL